MKANLASFVCLAAAVLVCGCATQSQKGVTPLEQEAVAAFRELPAVELSLPAEPVDSMMASAASIRFEQQGPGVLVTISRGFDARTQQPEGQLPQLWYEQNQFYVLTDPAAELYPDLSRRDGAAATN